MAIQGKVRITIYTPMYDNVIVLSLFSLLPKKQGENEIMKIPKWIEQKGITFDHDVILFPFSLPS